MTRKLEELFNECLERMSQGESVESCLSRYPEHAADLQVLLSTAINVRWRASRIQPDPKFKARARAQFIGAQYYAQRGQQLAQGLRRSPGIFSWQRAWVPAIGTVILVLFGSVGTAAAASNAMPDEALYPVKMATEQVQLTLAFADEDKAEINVKLAEKRSQEIAVLATKGKTDYVPAVTQNMISHLEQASIAIAKVETAEAITSAASATRPAALPPVKPPPTSSAPSAQPAPVVPQPQPSTVPPAPSAQPVPVVPQPQPSIVPPAPSANVPGKTDDGRTGVASQDTAKAATTKTTRLKELFDTTASKNVATLQNSLDKAPERVRPALQKAIEESRDKLQQIKRDSSLHQSPSSAPVTNPPVKSSLNKGTDQKPNDDDHDDNDDNDGKVTPNPIPPPPKTGTANPSPGTSSSAVR